MSIDIPEIKMTFFGQASYYIAFDLMTRVNSAISSWNPTHDYTRVILPNYFDTVTITLSNGTEKKYHYHKLMYGPMKTIRGKDEFKSRTDDEAFWLSQWGFEYSPFRVVQKILKDHGLYLVDHTFSGQVPFVYIYKYLPPRGVIKTIPWHGYHNIPNLNEADFTAMKLTGPQVITAGIGACIHMQVKFASLMDSIKDTSFKVCGIPVLATVGNILVPDAPPAPVHHVAHGGAGGARPSVRTYRDAVYGSSP